MPEIDTVNGENGAASSGRSRGGMLDWVDRRIEQLQEEFQGFDPTPWDLMPGATPVPREPVTQTPTPTETLADLFASTFAGSGDSGGILVVPTGPQAPRARGINWGMVAIVVGIGVVAYFIIRRVNGETFTKVIP